MTHPRTLRALTATIPLLQEARDVLRVAHIAQRLRNRIARCLGRLRRMKLLPAKTAPGTEGGRG